MDDHPIANDLDQELFSELVEPLVQPLLVHMVAPFVNGYDKNFSLQIIGKLLWEWRKLNGNLKKLFAILQGNLRLIGYTLEDSAFDRVANLLNTRNKKFVDKLNEERNGKRRKRKIDETWLTIALHPEEISKTPYDIVKEMGEKESELRHSNYQLQDAQVEEAEKMYEAMKEVHAEGHRGKKFSEVSGKQQQRHMSQIQKKAKKALWFAETYGLLPKSLVLSEENGQLHTININNSSEESATGQGNTVEGNEEINEDNENVTSKGE